MARLYIATPHTAAGALIPVATGTALKTVLQVGIPANTPINVWGWAASFDGATPGNAPGQVYLLDGDVAASVGTALTPDQWQIPGDIASACVGGAALTGYNFTTEGTITASRVLDPEFDHPQTGYGVWFPADARPRVGQSTARYLRIRTLFTVSVNVLPWIVWDE